MSRYLIEKSQNHMATTFVFCVSCEKQRLTSADQVLEEAHQRVHQIELELTEFMENSPVYQLNRSSVGEPIQANRSLIEIMEISDRLKQITQGAFDCTAKSEASANGDRIIWDRKKQVIWRTDDQALLGFGAIGKGYALDKVRLCLEQEGFHDFRLVGGGSSLIFSGYQDYEIPWRWGWSWCKDVDGTDLGIPFVHSTGRALGMGISGTHEKGDHIIGSPDGSPPPKSALVAHDSAAQADALSTGLFVMGWERAHRTETLAKVPTAMAVIDQQDRPRWTEGFQRLWGSPLLSYGLAALWILQTFSLGLWADDVEIDLSELGLDDFTPYIFERSPWWILFPVVLLLGVFLHLKKYRTYRGHTKDLMQDLNESQNKILPFHRDGK